MAKLPKRYVQDNPKASTVILAGQYVNLKRLADDLNIDHGYLCRIVGGGRNPSITFVKRVADALHMTVDEFLDAVEDRKTARDDTKPDRSHGREALFI